MSLSVGTFGAALLLSSSLARADLFPDCVNGPLAKNKVCDSSAGLTARAQGLVSALSLEEKFNLTGSTSPGVPRLGLPSYVWWQEALHGVASSPGVNFSSDGSYSYATSFPQPILMGAAFDDQLIMNVADVVSTEARAFNNANRSGLDYWTPNINPYRDPRWGRGQETPGEDPFHLGSYVKHLVNGLQGGQNPAIKKVVATCKHWVGYDMESWEGNERYRFDAQISTQDLFEYFMPPFQSCARDSNVGSVMCSYNAVNGVPTCADPYILQDVLRSHWNWTGDNQYVTSDCDAIQNVYLPHRYASSPAVAVADTLNAGTDLNCGTYYQLHLGEAFDQGLFNETTLDTSVMRLYSALIKLGYFDPASATPYRAYNFKNVNTPSAQALALKAAEEGITLLKNDGTLPLAVSASKKQTIGLIGGWANATTQLQGNYAGVAPFLTSPLIAAQRLPGVTVEFASGVGGQGDPTTDDWREAFAAANASDVIIYADGIDNSVESEGMDRYLIQWSGAQIDLITSLASLGKPLILLQMGGGQLDDTPFLNNPNISAIVWGGYPGQDGGTALMNIVTGKTAPAGRLPITQYPADYVRQVNMTNMALRPDGDYPGRTYKWYEGAVLPFGYGMHYTNFTLSVAKSSRTGTTFTTSSLLNSCTQTYKDLCPFTTLSVAVKNTGKTASDFSTLAFISGKFGPAPYPIKSLVAYQRLFSIAPGATQTAQLNMTLASLARRDENGNQVLYPGSYSVLLDQPTAATYNFTLTGPQVMLDKVPAPPQRGS